MDKTRIVRTETGRIIGEPQYIGIDKGVLKRTQEIMPKNDKLDSTKLKMSIQQKKEVKRCPAEWRVNLCQLYTQKRVSTQNVQRA